MNPEWIERQARVNFQPILEDGGNPDDVTVTPILITQEASPEITDDRAGDSLAILTICERMASGISINSSENMIVLGKREAVGTQCRRLARTGSRGTGTCCEFRYRGNEGITPAGSEVPEIPGNISSIW